MPFALFTVKTSEMLRYLSGRLHVRWHGGHRWRRHHSLWNWRRRGIRVISIVVTAVLIIAPLWIVTIVRLLIILLLVVAVVTLILVVVTVCFVAVKKKNI